MVRRTDYNGQTKTIAVGVAQTLVWTNSEIASERVVAYHVSLNGTAGGGNTLADIDRIRLSANGSNIINITPTQLRAYLQSYTCGQIQLPTTAQSFTIPLCLLDAPQPDMQDVSQFPMRSQVQLDLVFNTGAVAGSAYVGWTETSIAPALFPRILASNMNIPASTSLARYNFQENGVIRGIGLPQTGIDRAKIALGNEEFMFLPGDEFLAAAAADQGNLVTEVETLYGNGPWAGGSPLVTENFSRINAGISAPVDGSFIELQTTANWGGATEEVTVYAVAPNGPQVPQAA